MSNYNEDPRITLYALGQMSESEAKEFAMEIKDNQEALKEVEQIKSTVNLLREGFDTSKQQRLAPEQIETISMKYEKKKFGLLPKILGTIGVTGLAFIVLQPNLNFQKQTSAHKSTIVEKKEILENSKPNLDMTRSKGLAKRSAPQALSESSADMMIAPQSAPVLGGTGHAPGMEGAADYNTETYDFVKVNEFLRVADHPLSTFSTDVDTASYANARRFLNQGRLPPKDSIRVEEFINYFDYDYKAPSQDAKHPVAIYTEMTDSPFHANYKLVKIGLKAKELMMENRPKSNLVFLVDVSGSMADHNKLPLVKEAFKQMVRKMDSDEMISIVVYAGASGLALAPTPASEITTIFEALNRLNAGGSTNGGQGIELAYKTAKENFIKNGNNRVILVTDGDFNIGTTSQGSLVDLIKEKAKDNIFLTVLGVGMGNYKDSTLEKLADNGNGNYAYIDNLNEARKVLINDRFKTLHTIAKDVKLQVEFNPAHVEAYRLIGYENRKLENHEFNDDKKDAGDMGAGHTVTALYEIIPKGVKADIANVDKLKYQETSAPTAKSDSNEVMTVKLRYKNPTEDKSQLLEQVVTKSDKEFSKASSDFKFASAVAGYAMLLRQDSQLGEMTISQMIELAGDNKGEDKFEYRQEFIENMKISKDVFEKNKNWR